MPSFHIHARRLALLAGPLLAGWAMASPGFAATLEEEMRDLVVAHPQILAKKKAVSGADESIRKERSAYFPTAKLGGDEGYEYIDSPDRRGTQAKPFSDKRTSTSATLTQKIFDGFKTDASVDAAHTNRSISESDLRATRQNVLLEGAVAYLEVLRQTKLVALARESERKVTEQLNLEDERVQKGSGIATDVLSAKQRLQVAKERRIKFEGDFQAAVAKFSQVFGHGPDLGSLNDPPLPMDLIPPSLDEALDLAEKTNPTLEQASKAIQLTEDRKRIAEADYWPTLELQGKTDWEKGKNAVVGVRRDWSVLLVASWELFSGFKTDAAVAQASWDHAASKDTKLYTGRKIMEAVRTAWHKLDTARQRLDLLENAANLAEEVWEAQKTRHNEGKSTIQDVLDEENKINDARIQHTGAYYDMYQAAYELLSGMGQLEVDNVARARPAPAPDLKPIRSSLDAARARQSRALPGAQPSTYAATPFAPPARQPAPAQPQQPPPAVQALPKPGTPQAEAVAAMAEQMRATQPVPVNTAQDDFWSPRR